MKLKITYIISYINKALEFQWVADYLCNEFDFTFILLNPNKSQLGDYLIKKNISVYEVEYNGKKNYISTFWKCFKIIRKIKPDILHCHLIDANLIGLPIGKILGIKKNIYTRHHSSLHHIYHRHAIKYDKLCNRLATHIVAVSDVVKDILVNWENVSEKKIFTINHGIDINLFENINIDEIYKLKHKYNLTGKYPVIGVISRYTEWKGIQYIIPAFKEILKKYPNAKLVLANAKKGDFVKQIEKLLKEIPTENYIEIEFEPQNNVLYKGFDIFVHTPIDEHSEAFGQIYIEALVAEIPSVFTASGIGNYLKNIQAAEFVNYKDSKAIENSITYIIENYASVLDQIKSNKSMLKNEFSIENKIEKLRNLYVNN
ncbi:MAG: hypothetical protein A2046_14270 [Bacteroidetes bacterium GWA2_30_7]|nr:MAG: hypothetical protein A2046_14270 [Bacteroidetes bacterium GWA2_30_7]